MLSKVEFFLCFSFYKMEQTKNIGRSFNRCQTQLEKCCSNTRGSVLILYLNKGSVKSWCYLLYILIYLIYLNYLLKAKMEVNSVKWLTLYSLSDFSCINLCLLILLHHVFTLSVIFRFLILFFVVLGYTWVSRNPANSSDWIPKWR